MNENSKSLAERAYELWTARGQPHGSADQDWLNAERESRSETSPPAEPLDESLAESFPASDPPASHAADRIPSNADDKWRAAARKTDI
jgi:hypothetical protein